MVPLSRRALIGIPANASPVEETTLPARSEASSPASAAVGCKKMPAAAITTNIVTMLRFAFIAVTFSAVGWDARRSCDYCRSKQQQRYACPKDVEDAGPQKVEGVPRYWRYDASLSAHR